MKRIFYLCFFVVAVQACSKPYDPPDVVGAREFPGALTLATRSDGNRVRVIMSHGMCSGAHKHFGTDNWVSKRAGLIASAIGDNTFVPSWYYKPVKSYPDNQTIADSAVQRVDLSMRGQSGATFDMTFLLWGNTFDDARAEIQSVTIEDSSDRAPERAWLNAVLKDQLMNECFVDAVAYTGPRGDRVRKYVREALCDLMGGTIAGVNTGQTTETVKCDGLSRTQDSPVMLVPESLGAKVIMDAFLALDDGAGGRLKAAALGPVKSIHLATHQLPLLDTALAPESADTRSSDAYRSANRAIGVRDQPDRTNRLNDFLQVLDAQRTSRRGEDPLSLVVYYDPNDMFGYPLTSSYLAPRLDVSVTNVIVSNANTYLGVASNPLASHGNTARPDIARIIVEGSDALR